MYFCNKKTKHIFLFHASDRLHDQRKKKKPEVKADPKVQELQQRLEARKAGRLKRLFDNSDGENDNKLQALSGKASIQDITLLRRRARFPKCDMKPLKSCFSLTQAPTGICCLCCYITQCSPFSKRSATLLPSFQHLRGKKREALH